MHDIVHTVFPSELLYGIKVTEIIHIKCVVRFVLNDLDTNQAFNTSMSFEVYDVRLGIFI